MKGLRQVEACQLRGAEGKAEMLLNTVNTRECGVIESKRKGLGHAVTKNFSLKANGTYQSVLSREWGDLIKLMSQKTPLCLVSAYKIGEGKVDVGRSVRSLL